tara:strand:+ start:426 stop:1157 length:732 start_codon:yes stop_codon:yes gene_type:complete
MIFNIFKNKPTVLELMPERYIDIHSHILPCLDDGAKNIEDSISLISEMKKIGFKKIITTPHIYNGVYDNNFKTINAKKKELDDKYELGSFLKIGAEYMIDDYFEDLINSNDIITLKDKYVLVELSYIGAYKNYKNLLYSLVLKDYRPIIAHPERYLYFNGIEAFKKLADMGCLFQLNMLSITGMYGKKVSSLANDILTNNMYNFIGSDIHNLKHINEIKNRKIINNNLNQIKILFENNIKTFD